MSNVQIKPQRILFLINDHANWIDADFAILQSHFETAKLDLFSGPTFPSLLGLKLIIQSDVLFAWFGSLQFLPIFVIGILLQKKICVVSGGFDVAKADLVNHGAFTQSRPRQFLRKCLFKMADRVFAVSSFNAAEANTNARVMTEKLKIIPLGFLPLKENLNPWSQRKNRIVMISSLDKKNFVNKGGPHFIEIAKRLPDHEFIVVGSLSDDVRKTFQSEAPKNLRCTGFLNYRSPEFLQLLNDAKVILQLSYYESFCAAIIDGAMMGVYPIAWNRAALPETIQGLGETVAYADFEGLQRAVVKALSTEHDVEALSIKANQKFPIEKREASLVQEIKLLI